MGYRREQNVSCRNKNPQEFWGTSSPGTGRRCLRAHIAAVRERQAKTDACLVPLCPLALQELVA